MSPRQPEFLRLALGRALRLRHWSISFVATEAGSIRRTSEAGPNEPSPPLRRRQRFPTAFENATSCMCAGNRFAAFLARCFWRLLMRTAP